MSEFFTRALILGKDKIARNLPSVRGQIEYGKYEYTGDPAYLKKSVPLFQQALDAAPLDHPGRARHLSNLGAALHGSYLLTGETADLAAAVRMQREAVTMTPQGHRFRAGHLTNLGISLGTLSAETGDLDLMEEAVQAHRDALVGTPQSDRSNRANRLYALSLNLSKMFDQTGDPDVIAEAAQMIRDCIEATREGDAAADRAGRLMILGAILDDLFRQTDDPEVRAESVRAYRESVAATPAGHPDRSFRLLLVGGALLAAYGDTEDEAALTEARDLFAEVASSEVVSPGYRCLAYQALGLVAASDQDMATSLACYESAIALLPQIAPRRLSSPDRQRLLGEVTVSGLAAEAASVAIAAGQPGRAIELLEQARGIVLTDAMGARGDLTELQALAPGLTARFEHLRDAIDALDPAGLDPLANLHESLQMTSPAGGTPKEADTPKATRQIADERRHLAEEWDSLLAEIRAVPGQEGFLLPDSIEKLRDQASEGPIVFLNVSDDRCDALILTSEVSRSVRIVTLPGVSRADVINRANTLETAVESSLAASFPECLDAQEQISNILAWLWDEVAEPVLEELGFYGMPRAGKQWPRLWWYPVGEMTLLPLHAAGYHNRPRMKGSKATHRRSGARAVMDRVISSYTPTIRALRYARDNRSDASVGQPGDALIVAMPETPQALALAGAEDEARFLQSLLSESRVLRGAGATRAGVLARLPHHRIAHLACHGLTDRANPASSRLLLSDHADSPLTVTSISKLRLTGAELAFLSACSTSGSSRGLLDQAVHITAAFQLAGYQSVVGTLWPVIDEVAVQVTKDFYCHLTDNGAKSPQTSQAAQALHHAILGLRGNHPDNPAAWAGFVHAGR
jgi:tetratricopeptide (TPR) repeat protein